MTSEFGMFGKRGTIGTVAGSVVPEFPRGHPGLAGEESPTKDILEITGSGARVFSTRAGSLRKIFLPAHVPAGTKSARDRS